MAFCLPALAQRGQRERQQERRQPERQQRWGREPQEHRQAVREHRDEYRERRHRGPEIRDHYDGRRFDRDTFNRHWGRDHRFYWHHCRWYGPRYVRGSRFYYGGVWFVIVEPVPDYWGDGDVYIDDIDGVYYLVNPMYPQRIVVEVFIR